eukprot:1230523-Prymnesium_polylepis.1
MLLVRTGPSQQERRAVRHALAAVDANGSGVDSMSESGAKEDACAKLCAALRLRWSHSAQTSSQCRASSLQEPP